MNNVAEVMKDIFYNNGIYDLIDFMMERNPNEETTVFIVSALQAFNRSPKGALHNKNAPIYPYPRIVKNEIGKVMEANHD